MEDDAKHVVVIDDSQTTLLIIENVLKELDKTIQVKLFDRPESGLKYLKAHEPDLLILDLFMPGLNGLDILKHIHPVTGMKIFMISANTKVVEIESALKLGVDEYFTKPLKINALKKIITESLNLKEKYQI